MSFSLSLEKHPESDLGVFGLDKRAAAADEVSSSNAAADGVHYDSGTGQHKLVNKGGSGKYGVVIWLTTMPH